MSRFAIVEQIESASSWLSDSGKGIKECHGKCIGVKRSVRGITLTLDSGVRVCWRMTAALADSVMQTITVWHNVVPVDGTLVITHK